MVDYSGSFSGSFTGSILATNGVISSSAQVIGSLPAGVVSGSSQIDGGVLSIDYYDLSNLPVTITPFQANSILANNALRNDFANNVKVRLDAENVLSGSLKEQLPTGTISSSNQLISEFDDRYGNELGDGLVSGSSQITLIDADRTGFTTTHIDEGTNQYYTDTRVKTKLNFESVVSGSQQIKNLLPSGTVSSSNQITITESQISDLTHYTDSDVKTKLDVEGVISSSAQISEFGYLTSQTDEQTLSISGQTLTISNGNSVLLPQAGVGSGASIWNTGSQDPDSYTSLMTQNNLQVTGSFDIKGDFTVNGQSVFKQTSASDAGAAVVVEGRLKILEEQIGSYIASASIQLGDSSDTIDCGGFF